MSAAVLQNLLAAPDLPELIEKAELFLANERKRREKFYADITPEHTRHSVSFASGALRARIIPIISVLSASHQRFMDFFQPDDAAYPQETSG